MRVETLLQRLFAGELDMKTEEEEAAEAEGGKKDGAGRGEDCGMIYRYGEWNDAPCNNKYPSICSIGEIPDDVCPEKGI